MECHPANTARSTLQMVKIRPTNNSIRPRRSEHRIPRYRKARKARLFNRTDGLFPCLISVCGRFCPRFLLRRSFGELQRKEKYVDIILRFIYVFLIFYLAFNGIPCYHTYRTKERRFPDGNQKNNLRLNGNTRQTEQKRF